MVRLKVLSIEEKLGKLPFQFHYGTIKSLFLPNAMRFYSYFNSTMVRLKDRWLEFH